MSIWILFLDHIVGDSLSSHCYGLNIIFCFTAQGRKKTSVGGCTCAWRKEDFFYLVSTSHNTYSIPSEML
jgi:hypothetical protein